MFGKEVLQSEIQLVLLLTGETYEPYIFDDIDKSTQGSIFMDIFEEVIESFEDTEIGILYIVGRGLIFMEVQYM